MVGHKFLPFSPLLSGQSRTFLILGKNKESRETVSKIRNVGDLALYPKYPFAYSREFVRILGVFFSDIFSKMSSCRLRAERHELFSSMEEVHNVELTRD